VSDVAVDDAPTRRRVAPFVVGAVALALVGLVIVLITADKNVDQVVDSPLLGNPAPAVTGELADTTPFELSRRRGSWVVLNFFTHTCVPCIREHPELVEFAAQQAALGVDAAELYTVVRDSTRQEVERFFAERGGDWPVVYDPQFEFSNGFGVTRVPETWVIDPAGFVRLRFVGEVTAEGLGAAIQRVRSGAA
jgi:cytochrome c biogenesis protein CcmG/thiol:disulfide interchange protein DsbE